MFASSGERGEPCGMPRRWSRASVVRVLRPRLSVSSTGQSSHILIRCSTRRSTTRRATDLRRSECGMLPKDTTTHYPSPRLSTSGDDCKRNIEMTPLCKIEVTLPRVLGSREVCLGGVVDEQTG